MSVSRSLYFVGIFVSLLGSSHLTPSFAADPTELRAIALTHFAPLEPVAPARVDEPLATLGRKLFWDTRISANGKIACASCHQASDYGADSRPFSLDAKDKLTKRHSQTVFNSTLQTSLRWTSDRKSAADQAEKSLTGSMGLAAADAVIPILNDLGYAAAFQAAFPNDPTPVTPGHFGEAIEAYEATLVTPAPFDRFLAGDLAALSDEQRKGLQLFVDHGCVECHSGRLLGGESLRKFGVAKEYWLATGTQNVDWGRFTNTNKEEDRAVFRTSMLRNIAKTAPYFHDGSVAELREAVQIMADVQLGNRLSDHDAAAIVAFLDSLTGQIPAHYAPLNSADAR